MLGYESFGRFSDRVRKFEGKFGWVMRFFEKKIIFPLTLDLGINNDQSLKYKFLKKENIALLIF